MYVHIHMYTVLPVARRYNDTFTYIHMYTVLAVAAQHYSTHSASRCPALS